MAKSRTDVESVVKLVINGEQAKTSMKEITDSIRRYETEIKNMKREDNPALYAQKAAAIGQMKNALKAARDELNGVTKEAKEFHTSWKDIASGILAGAGIGAGVDMLKSFGAQVFETTAKFEKLEAVLTTTLGSRSMAQLAMSQLQDFASKTPFQVDELTESFVKLANQGFKPNMGQLRQLGDLSASTGKSFDQLAEAIIDAQTGEFERLKEFGIRASKQGDQVSFTFKGVTQTVKFTSDAIRDYITGLGDAEGVSGSMAGISETLSGKVSNLGDNWDSLLKTVGGETKGVFSMAIDVISDATEALTNYIQNLNIAQKYNAPGSGFWESMLGTITSVGGRGIDMASVKRAAFANMASSLDSQIGDAKYFSQLISIQKDLEVRQKAVDRTTREGAAAYQLYADKIALVKDKWESLRGERTQEQLKKESEAAKEAAAAAEKRRKEIEKAAAARKKELEQFDAMFAKMKQDFDISQLSGLDKKLEEIAKKYDPIIKKAEKLGKANDVAFLRNMKDVETENATSEDARAKGEELSKNLKGQYGKITEETNKKYSSKDVSLTEQLANGEISEQDYAKQSYALEEERLIALQLLAQTYGESSLEYDRQIAERKLDQRRKLKEGEEAIEAAQLDNMAAGVSLLKGLVNQRGAAFKALLVAEKAIAIAQIVMNLQREVAGYFAAYAAIPGGEIKAMGLSTAAAVRSKIAIATVVAQGAMEMFGGSDNSEKSGNSDNSGRSTTPTRYATGGVPEGPSHAQGGIKLIDGMTGAVLGEMEGGEPIISKDVYAQNPQLIDALLYAGQRRRGLSIRPSISGIAAGERAYRYGGSSSGSMRFAGGGVAPSPAAVDLSDVVAGLAALGAKFDGFAEKPWTFPMRQFYEADDKVQGVIDRATA